MGVSYWPRSPENTSLRRVAAPGAPARSPSVTHSSTLDEPRICPASRTWTVIPGRTSRGVSYASTSTWRSTASTSSRSNSAASRAGGHCLAIGTLGFAHQQVRRIAQQDGQQVGARRVGMDRSAKSALHQQRKASAVVYVRMTQDHGIDAGRVEGKRLPVARRCVRSTLDHAAVQQELAPARTQDVTGTCHFSRCSKEFQLHAVDTLTSVHPRTR